MSVLFISIPKRLALAVLCLCSGIGSLAGTNYTWTGAGANGNWSTLANWSPVPASTAVLPGADTTDNVTIGFVTGYSPILDKARTVSNLVLSNQTLDLNGFTLKVRGGASSFLNGVVKNGALDITGTETHSPFVDVLSGTTNSLAIGTGLIATSFNCTFSGLGYTAYATTGGAANPAFFLVPVGTATTITLAIQNPSNPNVYKTLQVAVNAQNQFTGVTMVEEDENYALSTAAYTIGNSKTYLNFSSSLLSTLFQVCSPGTTVRENLNFVRTQTMQVFHTDTATMNNLPVDSMVQSTTYLDGLGRSIQQVTKQVSPQRRDLIQIVEYDVNGRTPKDYLPYATDVCNGTFITPSTAKAQQQDFYTLNADPLVPKVIDPSLYTGIQNNAYSQTVYDGSPFDRVVEQASPGDPWKLLGNGTGKTQKALTRSNTVSDSVVRWTFDFSTGRASASTTSLPRCHAATMLYVQETTDENGAKQTVFTNKAGQLVLRRAQKNATTRMDTYYIYDDYGSLVYVVPPQAVTLMKGQNWTVLPSGSFTTRWLYVFQYDQRRRLVATQAPGASMTNVVYDLLDRPIMVQDGNLAVGNKWLFAKYDALGRKIMTGSCKDNSTSAARQAGIATLASTGVWYESPSGVAGSIQGYTVSNTYPTKSNYTTNPTVALAESDLLSVTFYDQYDFNRDGSPDYGYSTSELIGQEAFSSKSWGYPTGARVLNLETQTWLTSTVFYDRFGRVIQSKKNNHLYQKLTGGTLLADINTIVYDFVGKPLKTKQVHTPGGSLAKVTVNKRYTYDHVGRSVNIWQTNQNGTTTPDPEVLLSHSSYNELGQPIEKNLHSEDLGATYLQSVDYRYNIRGWLTGINNSTLSNDNGVTNNDANDLFGLSLFYEKSFGANNTPRHNGDITAQRWKSNNPSNPSSATEKAYVYAYDYASQLTSANYLEPSGTVWGNSSGKYNETNIAYDLNGNITALQRSDARGNAGLLDNLSYTFNGNQLTAMTDAGDKTAGFLSASTAPTQYYHDANGNLVTDANRNIALAYNHLNLPSTVAGTGANAGRNIAYSYSAAGQKLKKTVTTGTSSTITWYVDNFVYDGSNNTYSLLFFTTNEGRAVPNGSSFKYQYTITDQVGNARLSFDKGSDGKAEVVQEDHYYAFGLRMGGLGYVNGQANRYLFQGAEVESDQSLLNTYDYGWRQYDPALGRWHNQDPMQQYTSPYCFVGNSPTGHFDVGGMEDPGGRANGAFTGGYYGGNTTGARFGSDGLSLGGEEAIWLAAAGQAAAEAQESMMALGGFRGSTIGKAVEEETGGGRGFSEEETMNQKGFNVQPPVESGDVVNNMEEEQIRGTYQTPAVEVTGTQVDEGGRAVGILSLINGYVGTAVGTAEVSVGQYNIGSNWSVYAPKLDGRVFNGNQYVTTFNVKGVAKKAGIAGLILGGLFDLYGTKVYNTSGPKAEGAVSPGKATVNIGIGLGALLIGGPEGFIFGTGYWGLDTYYPGGAGGFLNDYDAANQSYYRNTGGYLHARP